jgi:large subunit ribosomal protein L24
MPAATRYKIRRGDLVTVITGKDKGKAGKVLSVSPKDGKVLVERVNIVKRHTKPNQEKEAPVAISKVMLLDPSTNKPARLGRKRLNDGSLVRFVKKSGQTIEAVKGNA